MPEITPAPSSGFDQKTYSRQYYEEHKERIKARQAAYQRDNREAVNAYHARYRRQLREEAISAYGGKCVCCGECGFLFLGIDHIDGGGNAHRAEVLGAKNRAGARFYAWLKRHGWPEGFRVLCFNCNMAREWNNGVCPHEQERSARSTAASAIHC